MQEIISSKNKKQPALVEVAPDSEVVIPTNNEAEQPSENREFEFTPESSQDTEETPSGFVEEAPSGFIEEVPSENTEESPATEDDNFS